MVLLKESCRGSVNTLGSRYAINNKAEYKYNHVWLREKQKNKQTCISKKHLMLNSRSRRPSPDTKRFNIKLVFK